jgi:hypothetical protein
MGARIRGHYRIDPAGRVEAVGDINSSLHRFAWQPPLSRDRASEQKARITKICMAGFGLACLGVALMASLPQIQRSVVASESARMAMIKREYLRTHQRPSLPWPEHRGHRAVSDH